VRGGGAAGRAQPSARAARPAPRGQDSLQSVMAITAEAVIHRYFTKATRPVALLSTGT